MSWTLYKQELHSILSNKRYMLSLAIQLILIFTLLPVFSSFFSAGTLELSTPALQGFIPLGVVDSSQGSELLLSSLRQNPRLELTMLPSYSQSLLEKGRLAAILVLPEGYDESLNKVLEVELYTYAPGLKSGAVYDAVHEAVQEAGEKLSERRRKVYGVEVESQLQVRRHLLKEVVVRRSGERFSSFFLTYLVPLMLFFPIFTVGSIIVDTVVGERERRTFESLIVSPVGRSDIVLAKCLSISSFVLAQLIAFILVLKLYAIPLGHSASILLILLLLDGAVIATALMTSYYARTVKEANILLMLLYTAFFIAIIISLSTSYFNINMPSTPFSLIAELAGGAERSVLPWAGALLGYTGLALAACAKLVERDDILFGPRPGVSELLADLSIWLYTLPGAGALYLTLIFGAYALVYATVLELGVGVLLVFAFGVTNILIPIFAFIEELVKPTGVYLLSNRRRLGKWEAISLGALAGAVFFALETLVFALLASHLFPARLLEILKLRVSTTLAVHVLGSALVGYGAAERKAFIPMLILSTLLHSAFNLFVTGGLI